MIKWENHSVLIKTALSPGKDINKGSVASKWIMCFPFILVIASITVAFNEILVLRREI